MKKTIKAIALSTTLALIFPHSVANAETDNEKETVWSEDAIVETLENISEEDLQFVEKVASIGEHYQGAEDGKLTVDLTDEEIKSNYDFSDSELEQLHAIMNLDQETLDRGKSDKRIVTTYDHRLGHISNNDLKYGAAATLVAAAEAGPYALEAAFIAWASIEAGPIGTLVASVGGALGFAFFADLALKITGAVAQGKGITFYSKWGFPPLRAEIEDD
ncbi:hypothetical protein [Corynebacterium mastitidis]|uniref:hypothetical protein n=2 Tax=Corynebacterium mastitidis TaxID=161890 RepID=UPI0030E8B941